MEIKISGNISTKKFIEALKELKKITSENSPRNYASAILIRNKDDGTYLVATDGFRLLEVNVSDKDNIWDKALNGLCIPCNSLPMILALLKSLPFFSVGRDKDSGQIIFKTRNNQLSISPQNIDFPKYDSVVPDTTKLKSRLFTAKLLREAIIGNKEIRLFFDENDDGAAIVIWADNYKSVLVPMKRS